MEKTITISKKLYDEIKDTLYHCEETMEELEQCSEYRFGDTLGHVRDTLSSMDL